MSAPHEVTELELRVAMLERGLDLVVAALRSFADRVEREDFAFTPEGVAVELRTVADAAELR